MAVERPQFPPVTDAVRDLFNPFTHRAAKDPDGPFRIGELSRLSGIPVGTIKFYLREGLVPLGQPTAKTQALYGTDHLRRLRLVRVLAEIGGLSIAQIKQVVHVLDGGDEEPGELAQLVAYAIAGSGDRRAAGGPAPDGEESPLQRAREATDAFVAWLGLEVDDASPARADLADALYALRTLGVADDPLVFTEHARLAYELAEFEMAVVNPVTDRGEAVEAIAVGSVVFGAAFMALRRLSHEHEARRRFDAAAQAAGAPGDAASG